LCSAAASPADAGEQRNWYAGIQVEASETDFAGIVTAASLCGSLGVTPCATGGEELSRSSFTTGYGALATLGARWGGHFRIEGELGYRKTDATQHATLVQTTAMLNGFVDMPVSDSITLSVGGGIGLDIASWDHRTAADADDTALAYQGVAEVSFALTDTIDLTVDYRYLSVGDIALEGARLQYTSTQTVAITIDELDTQSVSVGFRFAL
jgi:opacity protein-like surface antigen